MSEGGGLTSSARDLESFLDERRAALAQAWTDERARATASAHLDPLGESLGAITATATAVEEAHRSAELSQAAAGQAAARADQALGALAEELQQAQEWLARCRGEVEQAARAEGECERLVAEAEQALARAGSGCGMELGASAAGLVQAARRQAGQRRALRQVGGAAVVAGAVEAAWTLGPEVGQRLTGVDLPPQIEDDLIDHFRQNGLVMGAQISHWVKGVLGGKR